ncbi:Cro/C1-type HTH DNA-binding domain-containing protein [Micromonospora pallida]|uniref:Cro/C1-type HTH DNA-binding domain-containing protein n=1 Tax=Micromonospora pallida TaxID=145854 RepID=A0A1C6TN92_9ACTN|nr:helix-turn-helix transcriptional regulator [Micromonospora pallida]SCL43221.1 Cro/C1-type HTH DNA-binding domain-containing protein [Micromonospora pallida]
METATRAHLRHLVAEEIGAHLGRRRMSGAKLARAIERSEMYVSRRLRGETAFDLDDLERIAEVLGVTVTDLLPADKVRPNSRSADQAVRATSPARPAASRPKGRSAAESTRPTSSVPASRRRPTPINRPVGR